MKKRNILIGSGVVALAIIVLIIFIILNLPIKLDAPGDLTASYDGNGTIVLEWNGVEKAEQYELISDNGLQHITPDLMAALTDAEEGVTYHFSVRGMASRRGKTYTSEWTTYDLVVPVWMDAVTECNAIISGSYIRLDWNDSNGAGAYEFKLGESGEVYSFETSDARITNVEDGSEYSVYIRPVRTVGSHTYYGDWLIKNVAFPTYDYDSIVFEEALDLDLDRLKIWASTNGYSVDISEKDGIVYADLYCSDSANAGIANGLGRLLGGILGGYLVGSAESAESTYEEDFGQIDSMVKAFAEAGGIEEYANEKKEEIENAGKAGAIVYGLQALFADTKIHYIYRYTDTKDAAYVGEKYMMKCNHESYYTNRYGSFATEDDGCYHMVNSLTGNNYMIYPGTTMVNSVEYIATVFGHELQK